MYIDEHKFDIEKDMGGPLILKPRDEFDISQFIKMKREAILKFCEYEPFFVIRGVEMNEGSHIFNKTDYVNTDWHYDEGEIIILANNFEGNNRGKTEWVNNEVLIEAFLSQTAKMRNFDETVFSNPKMLVAFNELLDECESGNRESISRMLGVLYMAPDKPYELQDVLKHMAWKLAGNILTCNWLNHPKSTLFLSNTRGFHRGVYNVGQGLPLRRKSL